MTAAALPAVTPRSSATDFDEEERTWAFGTGVERADASTSQRVATPPPLPQRARSQTSTQCIGDWQIEGVLGRGGTATVYAVRHREFGKRAALKLSHARLDSGELGVKVFAREARVVQLVEHQAMPDVFATGMHEGRPFLVMERLRGETLSQRIERGNFDRTQALDVLIDVCDVLAVAHDANVVHRDLKLDNVFVLARSSESGHGVKLLDWGFACVLGEEDPLRGMIAGALNYVAPEQVRAQPITPAVDVYSLGVLVYRVLLGERPFSGTGAELVHSHVHSAPPAPALRWPDIPKPLAQLMVRMLAKCPSERPTLQEVRAELSRVRAMRRRRMSLTHAKELITSPVTLATRWTRGAVTAAIAVACLVIAAVAMVVT